VNMGGELLASPMTYELDGRQYVLVPVQDVLYAFALPASATSKPETTVNTGAVQKNAVH